MAGAVAALIVGLLAGLNLAISWFLSTYVQTELNDGWTYLWGYGKWNCWWLHAVWFDMSFGAVRNWDWHFYLSNFGINYVVPV